MLQAIWHVLLLRLAPPHFVVVLFSAWVAAGFAVTAGATVGADLKFLRDESTALAADAVATLPLRGSLLRKEVPSRHHDRLIGAAGTSALQNRPRYLMLDPRHETTVLTLDPEKSEACVEIIGKAAHIVSHDLKVRKARNEVIDTKEKALLAKLSLGSYGKTILEDLQVLMGTVSLTKAIQYGVVWTADDQNRLIKCSHHGRPFTPLEEHFEIETGEALVQGDMLPWEDDHSSRPGDLQNDLPSEKVGRAWTRGTVPYCFETGIAGKAETAFVQATSHIKAQVPCLGFHRVPFNVTSQSCEQLPSVLVSSGGSGCWSHVGQVSEGETRSQLLNLGTGCHTMGFAVHQVMHALGMVHHTARSDRDSFINVFEWHVDPRARYELDFANNDRAFEGSTFDFMSIMNLHPFAFSARGEPTMLAKRDVQLTAFLGQRMGLSEIDVEHLGALYNCPASIRPMAKTKELSSRLWEGRGYDDGFCRDETYTGILLEGELASCERLYEFCDSPLKAREVQRLCPVSCMKCVPGLIQMRSVPDLGTDASTSGASRPDVDGNGTIARRRIFDVDSDETQVGFNPAGVPNAANITLNATENATQDLTKTNAQTNATAREALNATSGLNASNKPLNATENATQDLTKTNAQTNATAREALNATSGLNASNKPLNATENATQDLTKTSEQTNGTLPAKILQAVVAEPQNATAELERTVQMAVERAMRKLNVSVIGTYVAGTSSNITAPNIAVPVSGIPSENSTVTSTNVTSTTSNITTSNTIAANDGVWRVQDEVRHEAQRVFEATRLAESWRHAAVVKRLADRKEVQRRIRMKNLSRALAKKNKVRGKETDSNKQQHRMLQKPHRTPTPTHEHVLEAKRTEDPYARATRPVDEDPRAGATRPVQGEVQAGEVEPLADEAKPLHRPEQVWRRALEAVDGRNRVANRSSSNCMNVSGVPCDAMSGGTASDRWHQWWHARNVLAKDNDTEKRQLAMDTAAASNGSVANDIWVAEEEAQKGIADQLSKCEDANSTGIRVRASGKPANCHDLRLYCNDSALGSRISSHCRMTCGLCNLELVERDGACVDKAAGDPPVYMVAGGYARCADLKSFCFSSAELRDKCQLTCQSCGGTINFEYSDLEPPKPIETTTLYPTENFPNWTVLINSTGCSRRRMFGYCVTRRRRVY